MFLLRICLFLLPFSLAAQEFTPAEIAAWEKQAARISIIRDNWGVPHVYGKSDADAVFGLLFAQCEDDFKRVELNYIEKLGRMAELKGPSALYSDLYIRLLIDSAEAVADYNKSSPSFKKLLDAFAAGINYYLYKNPAVKPALLTRFKPWYALLWTDGSIGAISTGEISENDVRDFYGKAGESISYKPLPDERTDGSNGFAIAPKLTQNGNAILYINPHTTFYFRPEVHIVSEEGLNAYGAVTWGQFFVYQGFNAYCGWMHTSGNMDVADLYAEQIVMKDKKPFYKYNKEVRPVREKKILLYSKEGDEIVPHSYTTYFTHHGPVMGKRNGQWVSVRSYNRSYNGLLQSWMRNKAKGFDDYKKLMDLRGNTSNNTVFADTKGNIAYWHGNYMPIRDTRFNWTRPVDGSISATEYKGLHTVEQTIHLYNPANGWIQNCNSTPFTAAGKYSPRKSDYPSYMAPDGENFRAINAIRLLGSQTDFTIDKVIATGYDTYLSAFAVLLPALLKAYEADRAAPTPGYSDLDAPIALLKQWDYYAGENSIATTVSIEWAQKLSSAIQRVYIQDGESDQVTKTTQFAATATGPQLLNPLREAINGLNILYGKWQVPWGEINRFQRLTGNVTEKYDDAQPSLPVAFTSSAWGCLPAYVSRYMNGSHKRYGYSGNSFVCVVEFGKKIRARSVLAGGVSGHSASSHFTDQAELFSKGKFKDILFYKEDVLQHAERSYKPGD